MAGKVKTAYVCSNCGYRTERWLGKCPECQSWSTLEEEVTYDAPREKGILCYDAVSCAVQTLSEIGTLDEERYLTGNGELDRVLGGGIVKGSLVLLGGEPGIGKSTLLLQICQYLCSSLSVLYVSGEESAKQIKLRADRLGVVSGKLKVTSITDMDSVIATIDKVVPDVVMIDSIQTMNIAAISSSSGSVTQVRECTNMLLRKAKSGNITVFVVGHVNKDGAIAGPKVLEHIVDAVLYFEGERFQSYRILRAIKNRFGNTNEIGVFEMNESGLSEVDNPSEMMLSGRPSSVSGTCVACVMEGSRPILAEVQALVSKTAYGNPRRVSTGFDFNRMSLILAVLEKRAGYYFSSLDSYINVIGGLRLDEPAADLPVALSLVSALKDVPLSDTTIAFGELGLAGEIRGVSHLKERIREAEKMGFDRCILPASAESQLKDISTDIELVYVRYIRQAIAAL